MKKEFFNFRPEKDGSLKIFKSTIINEEVIKEEDGGGYAWVGNR